MFGFEQAVGVGQVGAGENLVFIAESGGDQGEDLTIVVDDRDFRLGLHSGQWNPPQHGRRLENAALFAA